MMDNPSAFRGLAAGMTLRDWFAGQALAGYFAHPTTPHQNATDGAAYCYAMADAMLAARGPQ
jgi:hypothetical protein